MVQTQTAVLTLNSTSVACAVGTSDGDQSRLANSAAILPLRSLSPSEMPVTTRGSLLFSD